MPREAIPVDGQDLRRLGYKQGDVVCEGNRIKYHQRGCGEFHYDVVVEWERKGDKMVGMWSASSLLSEHSVESKGEKTVTAEVFSEKGELLKINNPFNDTFTVLS